MHGMTLMERLVSCLGTPVLGRTGVFSFSLNLQDTLTDVADHVEHVKPDLLRQIVRDALERLFGLHDPAKHTLDFLPGVEPSSDQRQDREARDNDTVVLRLRECDLGSEEGWERLADLYSGKKYKRCCGGS